jgi:Fic family protein
MSYSPPFTNTIKITNLAAEISNLVGQLVVMSDLADILHLRRENRIKTIQSSLAIENNTLTIEQVTAVLNGKRVLAPPNEILEVQNAGNAYDLMPFLDPYSIEDLLKAHGEMLKELKSDAGRFRTGEVGVMRGQEVVHMAPPANLVWPHMKDLFEWVKKTEYHPLISSSIFHYEFEFIHPFSDGNGRMGRYWQSILLSNWKSIFTWIPVESVIYGRQSQYYQALQESQSAADDAVFVEFMLSAIFDAVNEQYQNMQDNMQVNMQDNKRVAKLVLALGERTLSAIEINQRS